MITLMATTQQKADRKWLLRFRDVYYNEPNIGVVMAYHKLWERHQEEDVLVYMHDDVAIWEEWGEPIRDLFENPKVAIVGLGGATGIGHRDIYKTPYDIQQLARIGYRSNQTDWPQHGMLETGCCQVAVVDGFFMAVRGSFLRETGGWNWIHSNFHCYDTAMCLEAYRRGYEVWMTGVSCTHEGGGTSTTDEYAEWCKEHGSTMEAEHSRPHLWLYNEYRDLLPLRVGEDK